MDVRRLSVKVASASGHGIHALLPDEPVRCVVSVPGARQEQQATSEARIDKAAHFEDKELEFEYEGSTPRSLRVELHGRLPGADDLVGAGELDLAEVLERGTQQVLAVPLTKAGRELGAVELCITHRAMPGQ